MGQISQKKKPNKKQTRPPQKKKTNQKQPKHIHIYFWQLFEQLNMFLPHVIDDVTTLKFTSYFPKN